ncbi:nuclear transport factor 2 family protein [Saccharibacillus alkalitolerans]|uniref:Nuclear transport factor 2 family protein n=1 Tax=Saccharibacillus alkalitolerans TaxID=2705290 RepID=A0ABX0FC61_9BACL|nr:nuclear transport factor 2 family protein [Saccharibacillus alkalitolerans]NGZ77629.1 nuclear transport factor 2 family protein [Saccharibacillus alkalitolerans]
MKRPYKSAGIKSLPLAAALLAFGTLTAGCGANSATAPQSAPERQEAPSSKTDEKAEAAETTAADILKKEYYVGSMIKPEQVDLMNELFRAQNAGDAEAYEALLTADVPEADRGIPFKVEKADIYSVDAESDEGQPVRVEASVQEEKLGEYHPLIYTLEREGEQWRIGGIERSQGPMADETKFTGEQAEIVKLINASTRYRNEGDASAYQKLFAPNAQMGVLEDHPGKVAETLIANVRNPNESDTVIVNVRQRYEEAKKVTNPAYALRKEDGRWLIVDID